MKKIFTSVLFAAFALSASAQFAYNQTFAESDYNNASTIVASAGDKAWNASNGIRLGGSDTGAFSAPAWNWDDKFVVIALEAGHSKSLSFTTGVTSGSSTAGIGGNGFWYVAVGTSTDNLETIWSEKSKNNPGAVNLNLDKSVRYVKICFTGNFAGYVKNLVVSGTKAAITEGYVEATVCESELPYRFLDQDFTESGSVTLTAANIFNLDSVVNLTLHVLPSYDLTDDPIVLEEGTEEYWHDVNLSLLPVGDTLLVDSLQTELGCDSVTSVVVTITPKEVGPVTSFSTTTLAPAATKFFRGGTLYIRRDEALFDLRGARVE